MHHHRVSGRMDHRGGCNCGHPIVCIHHPDVRLDLPPVASENVLVQLHQLAGTVPVAQWRDAALHEEIGTVHSGDGGHIERFHHVSSESR